MYIYIVYIVQIHIDVYRCACGERKRKKREENKRGKMLTLGEPR